MSDTSSTADDSSLADLTALVESHGQRLTVLNQQCQSRTTQMSQRLETHGNDLKQYLRNALDEQTLVLSVQLKGSSSSSSQNVTNNNNSNNNTNSSHQGGGENSGGGGGGEDQQQQQQQQAGRGIIGGNFDSQRPTGLGLGGGSSKREHSSGRSIGGSGGLGLSGSLGVVRSTSSGTESGAVGSSPRMATQTAAAADVLLVEDVKVSQKLARATVAKMGYKPVVADNGEAAVVMFKQHIASLRIVLMDIHLGDGMTGVEATSIIRQYEQEHMAAGNPNHEKCIIMGLTGNVDDDKVKVYEEVGMNGCMLKGNLLKVGLEESLKQLELAPNNFVRLDKEPSLL
jgi:CheY-like chemotaxis protein